MDQVATAIKDKPGPATRRHQRPTGRDTLLEHRHRHVEMLIVRVGSLTGDVITQLDKVLGELAKTANNQGNVQDFISACTV